MVMRRANTHKGPKKALKDPQETSSITLDRNLNKGFRPITAFRIAFLILCTVGALLSADLWRMHFKVYKDPNYHAFCAMSEQVNCETVALSSYAVFAGLPVALWGLVGYFFMGGLCIWGLHKRSQPRSWPFGILFSLSLFCVLVSIALFIISHVFIHSFCIICVATYITNFLLFGLTIAELRHLRLGPLAALQNEIKALATRLFPSLLYFSNFAVVVLALCIALPAYWEVGITTGPGGLLVGNTAEGFPWIGARAPVLDVIEFSDYQCPHCIRGHMETRSLVIKYPDKIRLVHRHFPLSRHPHALAYSILSYCSGKQKHFWEANDYLFKNGRRKEPVTPSELANEIQINPEHLSECVDSKEAAIAVANDIAAGRDLKISGIPTYIIGNKSYPGRIPKEVISNAIQKKQDN